MAGFRTHVTFSSILGCGYTAAGFSLGMPLETAIVGGGLCGLSGMLPDLDSDTGIPLRESMAFAAAIVPALLLDRLREMNLRHDQIVLAVAGLYFFVRFGVTKMIAGRTSHRGMFHSIPAALIFAGAAFVICKMPDVTLRYFKAGGVFIGVMSHLVLDEIYSFQVKKGKIRVKRSFGTALKFWSKDTYSNFSTYTKLAIIVVLILSEPAVMERLDGRSPTLATTIERIKQEYFGIGGKAASAVDALQQRFQAAPADGQPVNPFRQPQAGYTEAPREPPPGVRDDYQGYFQPGVNYFEANADQPPDVPR